MRSAHTLSCFMICAAMFLPSLALADELDCKDVFTGTPADTRDEAMRVLHARDEVVVWIQTCSAFAGSSYYAHVYKVKVWEGGELMASQDLFGGTTASSLLGTSINSGSGTLTITVNEGGVYGEPSRLEKMQWSWSSRHNLLVQEGSELEKILGRHGRELKEKNFVKASQTLLEVASRGGVVIAPAWRVKRLDELLKGVHKEALRRSRKDKDSAAAWVDEFFSQLPQALAQANTALARSSREYYELALTPEQRDRKLTYTWSKTAANARLLNDLAFIVAQSGKPEHLRRAVLIYEQLAASMNRDTFRLVLYLNQGDALWALAKSTPQDPALLAAARAAYGIYLHLSKTTGKTPAERATQRAAP